MNRNVNHPETKELTGMSWSCRSAFSKIQERTSLLEMGILYTGFSAGGPVPADDILMGTWSDHEMEGSVHEV
jgi:hypothetical protein